MFRSSLLDEHVSRLRQTQTLQCLLQCGLEIGDRKRPAATLHPFHLRCDHIAQNEIASGFKPAIQINRCQNCFESIDEQGRLAAAAALFFTASETQIVAQFQLLRHLNQMPFADQMSPQFREFALTKMRKTMEEFFASHQRQDGIAKKLELLVVADPYLLLSLLRFLLTGLRTVGDCLFNDRTVPEVVTQPRFERRDFPFLHNRIEAEQIRRSCTLAFSESLAQQREPAPFRHSTC